MVFISGNSLLLSVPPPKSLFSSFYLYVCGILRENPHANEVVDRQAPVRLVFSNLSWLGINSEFNSEINKKGGRNIKETLKN